MCGHTWSRPARIALPSSGRLVRERTAASRRGATSVTWTWYADTAACDRRGPLLGQIDRRRGCVLLQPVVGPLLGQRPLFRRCLAAGIGVHVADRTVIPRP